MGKHSKNNTSLPYYTAAERAMDSKSAGYGTQTKRLAKESVRDFDCCWLTLQPCKEPVLTPQGYIYEKEAIYEALLHQKVDITRKQKAYEEQKKKLEGEKRHKEEEEKQLEITKFVQNETSVSGKKDGSEKPKMNLQHNFWIPANTPDAKVEVLQKPDTNTYCPFSGEKLRIKDLIPVKFTPLDEKTAGDRTVKHKYVCPITLKTLTNSVPCAVLRKSGRVVSMSAVNEIIKKDMIDPIDGSKIVEEDIIELQRGGTGYAGGGANIEAKKYTPAITN